MVGLLWDNEVKFPKVAGRFESWLGFGTLGYGVPDLDWTDILKLVGVLWEGATELDLLQHVVLLCLI